MTSPVFLAIMFGLPIYLCYCYYFKIVDLELGSWHKNTNFGAIDFGDFQRHLKKYVCLSSKCTITLPND